MTNNLLIIKLTPCNLDEKKPHHKILSLSNQNGFCTCFEMNNIDNLLIYRIKYVYM